MPTLLHVSLSLLRETGQTLSKHTEWSCTEEAADSNLNNFRFIYWASLQDTCIIRLLWTPPLSSRHPSPSHQIHPLDELFKSVSNLWALPSLLKEKLNLSHTARIPPRYLAPVPHTSHPFPTSDPALNTQERPSQTWGQLRHPEDLLEITLLGSTP